MFGDTMKHVNRQCLISGVVGEGGRPQSGKASLHSRVALNKVLPGWDVRDVFSEGLTQSKI